jgi:hypothetical protein
MFNFSARGRTDDRRIRKRAADIRRLPTSPPPGRPEWCGCSGILEDGIRICASLLGFTGCPELDKSDMRPARRVAQPHVQTAFVHLNLTYET